MRRDGFDSISNCGVRSGFARLLNRLFDVFCFGNREGSCQFDVIAEVHADGLVFGPYSLGSVGPKTIGQFGAVLDQAISDSGDQIGSTRANIMLRTSVSTANLMVYGGYRVDSDLTLVNLQTSAQSNLVTP